jgi:ligand-binding SRPBCC domain-containing protein
LGLEGRILLVDSKAGRVGGRAGYRAAINAALWYPRLIYGDGGVALMLKRGLVAGIGAAAGLLAAARLVAAISGGEKREPSKRDHLYVLERSQLIPAPPHKLFPFFEDPSNLARITPKRMGFEIRGFENLPMQRSTKIEYRIRPLGVPQRWITEIVEYRPPREFVDVQTKGPYRYWRHQHTFDDVDGGTLMRDRVQYQMPLGPIGRLAHFLFVSRMLRDIFTYREKVIRGTFQSAAAEKEESR